LSDNIDHTKAKVRSPQSNKICERYQLSFRKRLYETLDKLQFDLGEWLEYFKIMNEHIKGKMYYGRTPMQTLEDGK